MTALHMWSLIFKPEYLINKKYVYSVQYCLPNIPIIMSEAVDTQTDKQKHRISGNIKIQTEDKVQTEDKGSDRR